MTRANGILTSFIQPTGGVISGQGCLIDLNGWVPRELVIADAVALNVRIPAYVSRIAEGRTVRPGPAGPGPRPGPAASAADARERAEGTARQDQGAVPAGRWPTTPWCTRPASAANRPPRPILRLEAMVPYARGEKPVIFHADQQVEILDALELARELKLKAVISGAAEAWKVAEAHQEGQGARAARRHAQPAAEGLRPLRLGLCQPGEAARRGRDVRDPVPVGRPGAARPPRATSPTRRRPPSRSASPRRSRSRPSRSPRRRSSASPTRSVRSRPASGPTWSSPRATSSSRRRPCSRCSSTASRSGPRAATPSSTPSIAAGWTRSGPAGHGWGSIKSPTRLSGHELPSTPPPTQPSGNESISQPAVS